MGPNGFIELHCLWTHTSSGNNKILRARFGGGSGTIHFQATATTNNEYTLFTVIHNRNAENSQVSRGWSSLGGAGVSPATGAIDTSADTTLVITGQKATGSETLTLESYLAKLHYRP
jgi:hypothetical protein